MAPQLEPEGRERGWGWAGRWGGEGLVHPPEASPQPGQSLLRHHSNDAGLHLLGADAPGTAVLSCDQQTPHRTVVVSPGSVGFLGPSTANHPLPSDAPDIDDGFLWGPGVRLETGCSNR